ncbi:serine hydrolase domain-containing protein [Aminipila sp.]|uniref:serine hydrolase domain-containing protein n=1 Tax=Aminipila sp. TaxID=2060095 RepID=UPI00289A2ADF|nr:serine hydrolase domain-containing protein [Aminipila sp.]
MQKFMKILLILTCVGISAALVYGGASNQKSPEEIADELYSSCNNPGNPSISVLVAKDGEIIVEKSYGLRNVETEEKATPATNYRLGCITKPFTSMGILILKERGLIELDWPVNKVLTDFPEYAKNVTIRNLLQNSSGLPKYESLWSKNGATFYDKDVYELIKKNDKLLFHPGYRVEIDNDTNFAILALVIEKISGMKYQDFMSENIFKPLGMNNTVALVEGYNTVPERAYGSVRKEQGFVVEDQSAYSAVLGDGGIYSNVHDLYLWDQALEGNKIVSAETTEEAMKTDKGISEPYFYGSYYSCGWHLETMWGHPIIQIGGETIGFTGHYIRVPEKKVCVIILTNYDQHWGVVEDAEKLAKSVL